MAYTNENKKGYYKIWLVAITDDAELLQESEDMGAIDEQNRIIDGFNREKGRTVYHHLENIGDYIRHLGLQRKAKSIYQSIYNELVVSKETKYEGWEGQGYWKDINRNDGKWPFARQYYLLQNEDPKLQKYVEILAAGHINAITVIFDEQEIRDFFAQNPGKLPKKVRQLTVEDLSEEVRSKLHKAPADSVQRQMEAGADRLLPASEPRGIRIKTVPGAGIAVQRRNVPITGVFVQRQAYAPLPGVVAVGAQPLGDHVQRQSGAAVTPEPLVAGKTKEELEALISVKTEQYRQSRNVEIGVAALLLPEFRRIIRDFEAFTFESDLEEEKKRLNDELRKLEGDAGVDANRRRQETNRQIRQLDYELETTGKVFDGIKKYMGDLLAKKIDEITRKKVGEAAAKRIKERTASLEAAKGPEAKKTSEITAQEKKQIAKDVKKEIGENPAAQAEIAAEAQEETARFLAGASAAPLCNFIAHYLYYRAIGRIPEEKPFAKWYVEELREGISSERPAAGSPTAQRSPEACVKEQGW